MAFELSNRLWVYTNYECNLSCSYCVVKSHPKAEPRAIGLDVFERLLDEALPLGFDELYLTGGEPFIHPRIFDLLDYAVRRIATTVLTNATLFTPHRMERLKALPAGEGGSLTLQVSVDSARPDRNDLYRGSGSWLQTMRGVDALLNQGFKARIGATATAESDGGGGEAALVDFFSTKGIDKDDVFVRPLIRRGFSKRGKDLYADRVLPEVCVDRDGVYWHPLSTDPDFQVTGEIFPFSRAVGLIRSEMDRREREGIESLAYQ
jgi:MoaA/NifB/PqqE/SkfB family radical SAM enzyme